MRIILERQKRYNDDDDTSNNASVIGFINPCPYLMYLSNRDFIYNFQLDILLRTYVWIER